MIRILFVSLFTLCAATCSPEQPDKLDDPVHGELDDENCADAATTADSNSTKAPTDGAVLQELDEQLEHQLDEADNVLRVLRADSDDREEI